MSSVGFKSVWKKASKRATAKYAVRILREESSLPAIQMIHSAVCLLDSLLKSERREKRMKQRQDNSQIFGAVQTDARRVI
jgi:hypothetical protein